MIKMKTQSALKILSLIDKTWNGIEFIADERNNFSLALLDISFDHCKSILILCENGLFASAYALARPMYECFIRGAWIQHCATQKQIEKIKEKDEFPLTLRNMVKNVESKTKWPKALSNMMKYLIKNMHSYTHGGVQIVARRFDGDNMVHLPDTEEINALFRFLLIIAFVAFTETLSISGIENKNKAMNNIYSLIIDQHFKNIPL